MSQLLQGIIANGTTGNVREVSQLRAIVGITQDLTPKNITASAFAQGGVPLKKYLRFLKISAGKIFRDELSVPGIRGVLFAMPAC
jgi:hypothetical protein